MSDPPRLNASPPPVRWRPLAALLQSRNLNAYALIALGGLGFAVKMPDSIYGGLILGGLAILRAGPDR